MKALVEVPYERLIMQSNSWPQTSDQGKQRVRCKTLPAQSYAQDLQRFQVKTATLLFMNTSALRSLNVAMNITKTAVSSFERSVWHE